MDATLKETNLWRSLKKFFVDGLKGTGIVPYFERVLHRPTKDAPEKWINVMLENPVPGHVSDASMTIFCFSKKDLEGDELADVRDEVINLLYVGYIDLYDATTDPDNWTKVGGIKVTVNNQSNTIYNPDNSKMIYIQTILKWGAVWS
jgi:hypothetical protein